MGTLLGVLLAVGIVFNRRDGYVGNAVGSCQSGTIFPFSGDCTDGLGGGAERRGRVRLCCPRR